MTAKREVKASNVIKKKEKETIFLNLNKPFLEKTHILFYITQHIYTYLFIYINII